MNNQITIDQTEVDMRSRSPDGNVTKVHVKRKSPSIPRFFLLTYQVQPRFPKGIIFDVQL